MKVYMEDLHTMHTVNIRMNLLLDRRERHGKKRLVMKEVLFSVVFVTFSLSWAP